MKSIFTLALNESDIIKSSLNDFDCFRSDRLTG